jgi:hypothetical protein
MLMLPKEMEDVFTHNLYRNLVLNILYLCKLSKVTIDVDF